MNGLLINLLKVRMVFELCECPILTSQHTDRDSGWMDILICDYVINYH